MTEKFREGPVRGENAGKSGLANDGAIKKSPAGTAVRPPPPPRPTPKK